MINLPYEDIVNKIQLQSNISKQEIETKIQSKLTQLSGLISKEGAAHIVANELGVKIFETSGGKLKIKNILSGMRSVETVGVVDRVYEVRNFQTAERKGKVGSFVLSDDTSSIRIVLWGELADNLSQLSQGVPVKIIGGFVKDNQGRIEVHMNDKSRLVVNPLGEQIKARSYEAIRKKISEITETDSNVELLGTIVQVYDLRFYEVCPQCQKRTRQQESGFVCETHGSIIPTYSYMLSLTLDDGSETIRTIFFRNQVENLLLQKQESILGFRERPEQFDNYKTQLLGTIIKVVGKVNNNKMFDRKEFVANNVVTSPDPAEEIKKLSNPQPL
jgi:replication factor A1